MNDRQTSSDLEGATCAIYLRVSSAEQAADDHVSLDVQREQCLAYAQRQGWGPLGDGQTGDLVFLDVRSGLEVEKRDAYQRLLALARTEQIKVILVWRYDRFGRDDGELITRYAELTRLGVKLVSATEGEHQPVMFKFAAIMQYEESKRISERVKPALAKRSADGYWIGRIPFGYVSVGPRTGLLVEDGHKAQVVRTLFARYVAGESIRALRLWLNTCAGPNGGPLPSPLGALWTDVQVRRMLANVAYTGRRLINWASYSKITGRSHGNPNAQIVQGRHPALVDDATFARAAERLSANPKRHRVAEGRQWLLTGMIFCGVCGNHMHGEWTRDRRRPGRLYVLSQYRCRHKHGHPSSRWIDQAVLDAVGRLPLTRAAIDRAAALFAERTAQLPDRTAELASARTQLARRLERATALVLDGTLSTTVYRQQREALEAEMARLDGELARLSAPSHEARGVLTQLARWLADAGDVGAILDQGDLDEQAAVIAGAVERVIFHGGRELEIVWRPWAEALAEAAGAVERQGA
jgi:site-specific DNA recombinase